MINKSIFTFLTILVCSTATNAANTAITNKISGVGFDSGREDVYLCYNHIKDQYNYNSGNIKPKESLYLPNGHFTNFFARLGGCSLSNTYLGNFTVSSNQNGKVTIKDYTHNDETMIKGLTLSSSSIVGETVYLPPEHVVLTTPKNSGKLPYLGINLSGNEFGKYWSPLNSPKPEEMQAYIDAGMNTFRLPIRWAYLQPQGPGVGDLDANYLGFIENFLENASQYKINVILDLHNYLRYSKVGLGVAGVPAGGSRPDGEIVTEGQQMVDVWTKLSSALVANKAIDQNYVIFDLSNEPTELSSVGGTEVALDYQNQIINALRNHGAKNLILVEGSNWTGLHSWTEAGHDNTTANSTIFTKDSIVDPENNFAINVHQYFDEDFSRTHDDCVADMDRIHMSEFVNYLKKNKFKAIVTEFGTARGNNCMQALSDFLNMVDANAYDETEGYGFIGWTAWAGGHGWGSYENYNLYIDTQSPQMDILKEHLPE